MFTSLKRIFRSGIIDFWRNSFVSLASVFVITVTLFVIGSLVFLRAVLDSSLAQLKEKVDVNVYFVTSAAEEDILGIKSSLEQMPEVAEVEYVSRDEALVRFRERHENDELTLQALDELDDNPLGAVLNVSAKDPSHYESIARFLETSNALSSDGVPIIDTINFFQNEVAIEKIASIITSSERLGLGITLLLIILSVLITFNTIRLAIYTARDEIAVMRLVGASNTYVRGPFVIEGIVAGFIAAVVSLALFYPLALWLGPITENFFSGINIFEYYMANLLEMIMLIIGAGILLGALSSFLAVKKYLRV
jgi:cell division transport system permease protein